MMKVKFAIFAAWAGIFMSSQAARTRKQAAMSPISPRSIFAALLTLSLVLFASPLLAGLEYAQKFVTGNTEFGIVTYTNPTTDEKIGLLGIASSTRISMAFKRSEWSKLISLCNKAININATTWVVVGTMSEPNNADVAQLTISAGPGVTFTITTPKRGTNSYVVQKKDYPLLQSALLKVEAGFPK
jgi:hypothetical protein